MLKKKNLKVKDIIYDLKVREEILGGHRTFTYLDIILAANNKSIGNVSKTIRQK